MKLAQVKILLKFLVSFGLITYLLKIINWHDVHHLSSTAAFLIMIGGLNSLFVMFFMALRWALLTKSESGHVVALKIAYQGYLIGSFYNMIMPGSIGGDVVRIKYGHDQFGVSLKTSTLIIMAERITGAVVQIFLLLIGAAIGGYTLLSDQLRSGGILLIISVGIAASIALFFLSKKLRVSLQTAGKVFLLSILAQGTDLIISTLFLFYLWPKAEFFWLLIVMPLSFFATVLPISLSGLGVRECVMVGILRVFHVDASQAVIFSLMLYFSKMFVALVGGTTLLFNAHKTKQNSA